MKTVLPQSDTTTSITWHNRRALHSNCINTVHFPRKAAAYQYATSAEALVAGNAGGIIALKAIGARREASDVT